MLNSLPSELILHILAFISPKQVLKYRRLSRRYNSFLLNRAFAVKNLSLFLPKPPTRSTRRTVDFDALWFKWPDVYQRVYCQLHWSQLESFGICQLIGGPLPPAITTIKTLVRIRVLFNHFRGNNICGPLPQDIGSLTSLKRVELQK
ncbi:hypothetical protein HDU79_007078 [Rhizoclosmatium sp. JEL0117]|nr:hypothetical protein HDU79_007078 [Rhizoclosmatium sp. JEL0117]